MDLKVLAGPIPSQTLFERVSAYGAATKNYLNTHKVECTLITVAVGVIAYLSTQNQPCPLPQCAELEEFDFSSLAPSNEWTLSGEPNPLTTAFESTDVCAKIQSIATGSLLEGIQRVDIDMDRFEKIPMKYGFFNPNVSPMALAIHNNCQALARTEKAEIYNPDFDLSKLETLIIAAASSKNFPLWEELTNLYMKNAGFEAVDEKASHIQTKILTRSGAASAYPPSASGFCAGTYGTPYDVTVSLKDVDEGLIFFSKIYHSKIGRFSLHEMLQKFENELNFDEEKLTGPEIDKLNLSRSRLKLNLQAFPFPALIRAEMQAYPKVTELIL